MKQSEREIKNKLKQSMPIFQKDFNYVISNSQFQPIYKNFNRYLGRVAVLVGCAVLVTTSIIMFTNLPKTPEPSTSSPETKITSSTKINTTSKITVPSLSTQETVTLGRQEMVPFQDARRLFGNEITAANHPSFKHYLITYSNNGKVISLRYEYLDGSITVTSETNFDKSQFIEYRDDGKTFYISKTSGNGRIEIVSLSDKFLFTALFNNRSQSYILELMKEIIL